MRETLLDLLFLSLSNHLDKMTNFELAPPAIPTTGFVRTRIGRSLATSVRSVRSSEDGSKRGGTETQQDDSVRGNGDSAQDHPLSIDSDTEQSATDLPRPVDRDRQILIVGAGITGLALATFLVQRGYDPVVLADRDPEYQSRIAVLQPPARRILDQAGIPADLSDQSQRTKPLTVRTADGERSLDTQAGSDTEPLYVSRATLGARLRERVPDTLVRMHDIEDVSEDRGAVQVTFDTGVREWFDLVVGTDGSPGSLPRVQDSVEDWSWLHQYETVVEDGDSKRSLDYWTPKALTQVRTLPDTDGTMARITTPRDMASSSDTLETGVGLSAADVESSVLASLLREDVEDMDHTPVPQVDQDGAHWGDGRVGYCGPAAFRVTPASGLATSIGLADAWVLASELDTESPSINDVIERYSQRRAQRIEQLFSAVERPAERRVSDDPFTRFKRFRTVAYNESVDVESEPSFVEIL